MCDNAQYFHNHVNDTLKMLNANLKSEDILDIIDDYKGIGYAKSTKQELELLRNVAFSSGFISTLKTDFKRCHFRSSLFGKSSKWFIE